MADTEFYKTNRTVPTDSSIPLITTDLDSVRAYQFEVQFTNAPEIDAQEATLAAKSVGTTGFSVADIVVNRVNDKVHYPGKPSPESLTITFDNILRDTVDKDLWDWFKGTYDPMTGHLGAMADQKIASMKVHQLNHDLTIRGSTVYYGVYPTSYKLAEFNYATDEFHTIEVTFRYDFMEQTSKIG